MMPPLLPPTESAPAAFVPAPTTVPAPAPATAAPQAPVSSGCDEATVELPQVEKSAERLALRPAATSLRSRLSAPRLRRPAAAAAVELLAPGAELTRVEDMRRPFRRPMTVLVANPKGGSGKTPLTLLLAGTLALMRGGHVLAWDNNEARGGLAFRANPRGVARLGEDGNLTVRDLLADLALFESHAAGMGELAAYLRPQDELFDVLAADSDPASLAQIRSADFARLHAVLRRYYRILILDSGNNVRSEAWQSAALAADCLVLTSSYDADSVAAADWTLEHLTSIGRADLVDRAVTVLTAAGGRPDPAARAEAHARFARTAAIVDLAYDPKLRGGERIGRATVAEATTNAAILAAQAVVAQLSLVDAPSGAPAAGETAELEPGSTAEFEDAAAEALAIVEHSRRPVTPLLPLSAPAPVVPMPTLTVVPDLPADEASEDVEPTVLDMAKAAAAKVVAAQAAAPKRRTATARTTTARTTSQPTAPKAVPSIADSALQVRPEPQKRAPGALSAQKKEAAPEAVVAPRKSKEPTSTRRIAKPRTDAPVSANPPAADAPAPAGNSADSGEVVSTDPPFLFTAGTAAGVAGLRPKDRS